MARSHPVLAVVTLVYLVAIATLTFIGGEGAAPPSPWWSLVAFIGVGALLCAISAPRRWWVALGFGVLGAAWIEVAQSVWRPEGWASVTDLALGALGTALGVGAVVLVRTWLSRTASVAPAVPAATAVPSPRGGVEAHPQTRS